MRKGIELRAKGGARRGHCQQNLGLEVTASVTICQVGNKDRRLNGLPVRPARTHACFQNLKGWVDRPILGRSERAAASQLRRGSKPRRPSEPLPLELQL